MDLIKRYNYEFINRLTGKEPLDVDEKGRLFVVKESPITTFINRHLKGIHPKVSQVLLDYALEKLKTREFHHIQEGPDAYQQLQKQLSALHLITKEQRYLLASIWYDQRYHDLVKNGMSHLEAKQLIAKEKTQDANWAISTAD